MTLNGVSRCFPIPSIRCHTLLFELIFHGALRAGFGKFTDKTDIARNHKIRHMGFTVTHEIHRVDGLAGLWHHCHHDVVFAQVRRNGVCGRLQNLGVTVDDLFHFKRRNIFPTPPHKIAFAIDKKEVIVFILISQIATANPAPTGFFFRGFGIFVIFRQSATAFGAVDELADFARRQLVVIVVHHLHLIRRASFAHRAHFTFGLGLGVNHEPAFGLRVKLHDLHAKALFKGFPNRLGGGCAEHHAHGVVRVVGLFRLLGQDRNHGAQTQGIGGTVASAILPKPTGAKAFGHGHLGVCGHGHPDHILAADVKQGQGVVDHVLFVEAGHNR